MTEKTYHFMAGLPRSGSTLLSAILNQNPRFYSGPSSPVVPTILTIEQSLNQDELFLAYPKNDFARNLIGSVLIQYYADTDKPIIFEKNRSWVSRINYIPGYFGIENPKIIYPVRDIGEILASFISMIQRNPHIVNERVNFIDQSLIQNGIPINDHNRCQAIAGGGILGQSLDGLKKALSEGYRANIHFVEYSDLVSNTKETMEKLYDFIEEDYFDHDFDNIQNVHQENDVQIYGFTDMHEVRKSIESTATPPKEILPESVLNSIKDAEFWRQLPELENKKENTFFGQIINNDTTEEDTRFI